MILTVKEVMQLLECSESTARNHMKSIREKFNTKFVTKWHMADYLCIDNLALEISFQYKVKKDIDKAREINSQRIKTMDLTKQRPIYSGENP